MMFGPWTVATLLLIHVGTSDTAKKDVEQITSDCRQIADWGQQWRIVGAYVSPLIYA